MRNEALERELALAGCIVPGLMGDLEPEWRFRFDVAMDAQPQLATVSNSGVPSYLTNWIDPSFVEILFSPMKAAIIVGEEKKGDWLSDTAIFPVVEATGEVSSYGDYNNGGSSGANTNYPQRQSYHYQTITQYGQRELERQGLARLDWVGRLNEASILTLNKYQNKTYFFGVANLKNYGLLNDPSLSAPIGQTSAWSTSAAEVIFEDIRRLFTKLQTQCNGLIDNSATMILAMSPVVLTYLLKTNQYNVNVFDQLKKNFPNMRIENAPEYNISGSGEMVQMIVESIDGQRTATTAFTEKMRAFPIIQQLSSFMQKKMQGTWGTIIKMPFAIAAMQPIT